MSSKCSQSINSEKRSAETEPSGRGSMQLTSLQLKACVESLAAKNLEDKIELGSARGWSVHRLCILVGMNEGNFTEIQAAM